MNPEYIPDASVDAALDELIRSLLTTCFTGPHDAVFKTQRYFKDPYPHRWIIRDGQGGLVAHVGVHEKRIMADGITYRAIGMAEVCVHPDWRGRGLVGAIFREIHAWAIQQGYPFSLLYGDPKIYTSSGYTTVHNLFYESVGADGAPTRILTTAMVKPLATTPWPTSDVLLEGSTF